MKKILIFVGMICQGFVKSGADQKSLASKDAFSVDFQAFFLKKYI